MSSEDLAEFRAFVELLNRIYIDYVHAPNEDDIRVEGGILIPLSREDLRKRNLACGWDLEHLRIRVLEIPPPADLAWAQWRDWINKAASLHSELLRRPGSGSDWQVALDALDAWQPLRDLLRLLEAESARKRAQALLTNVDSLPVPARNGVTKRPTVPTEHKAMFKLYKEFHAEMTATEQRPSRKRFESYQQEPIDDKKVSRFWNWLEGYKRQLRRKGQTI
jgi:hypothetical protein